MRSGLAGFLCVVPSPVAAQQSAMYAPAQAGSRVVSFMVLQRIVVRMAG